MRRGWTISMSLLVALDGACAHTKSTDSGEAKNAEKRESKRAKTGEPGTGKNAELHPGHPEKVPVATAPEALLAPGADDEIREKLVARGVLTSDDTTREGIRRFQHTEDLPVTGM